MARKIEIEITGDTRALDRALGRSQSNLKRFGKLAAKGALALGTAVAAGSVVAVKAASNLEEQINKTSVVFRGSERRIIAWSETTAQAFGISQRAALEAAGTFGNMLVPMGLSRREAGKMATTMVELGADMASFNNASPEETLDALRAGLAGETEPLRKFGVFLNEARIKEQALRMGLIKQGEELDAAAKAQAIYGIVMKDTKDAQGDFERTSGSMANQQRILKAQFEDTAASIGAKLLPIAVKLLTAFNDLIVWGQEHWPQFRDAISNAFDVARQKAQVAIDWFRTNVLPIIMNIVNGARALWKRFGDDIKRNLRVAVEIIRSLLNVAKGIVKAVLAVLRGDWSEAWNALKDIARNAMHGLITMLRGIKDNIIAAAKAIGTGIKDAIVAGVRGLGSLLASLVRGAINVVIDAIRGFGIPSFKIDPPGPGSFSFPGIHPFSGIPSLATGGTVERSGLASIHRGETIVPARVLNGSGGGGGALRYVVLMNEEAVSLLRRMSQDDRRRGGQGIV